MRPRLHWVCFVFVAAGCASAPGPGPAGAAPSGVEAARDAGAHKLPPSGFGTLRQDEFTVDLRSQAVHLRVTPLDESILRLAAPDTHRRLSSLAASLRAADAPDGWPGTGTTMPDSVGTARNASGLGVAPASAALFLVSFFAREAGHTFEPADVTIESGGREFRPARIVPLTPGWGEQRLQQQQQEMAVYQFDGAPDLSQPMTVRYGSAISREWENVVPRLQAEQARVLVRAASRDGGI